MPAVTVVIPTHNRAYLIARTVGYVLDQTYDDFKVIVVDNGSKDNTKDVVAGITDSRVQYIYQEDTGSPASPRNTGISQARGNYVAFLDDDDVWYPTKLEQVVEVFTQDPDIAVVCHYEDERRFGEIRGVLRYGPAEPDMYRRLLFGGNCLSGSATTVKTEALRAVGGCREERGYFEIEDYDLWIRLARAGAKFAFIDEPLGEFVVHESSGVFAGLHRRFPNHRRMLKEHFQSYEPKSFGVYLRFQLVIARTYLDQVKLYLSVWRRKIMNRLMQATRHGIQRDLNREAP